MTHQPNPKSRYVLFAAVASIGLTLDLATKSWIFVHRGMPFEKEPIWLIDGLLSLETSLNEGALFGIGAGWGILFIALSFAAILGIGYWIIWAGAAHDRVLSFALGGILAGILGNLYDRLGLPGLVHSDGRAVYAVRDFIHFWYGGYDLPILGESWPIFNLADSMLVCGVGLLIFHAYLLEPRKKAT